MLNQSSLEALTEIQSIQDILAKIFIDCQVFSPVRVHRYS